MTEQVEREFREGKRWVPSYIDLQLPEDEILVTMTYHQAMEYINTEQMNRHLRGAQDALVSRHFRDQRG